MALRKVGALWTKINSDGKTTFSGVIETLNGNVRIQIFPNDRERTDGDKKPDYNVCIATDDHKNEA